MSAGFVERKRAKKTVSLLPTPLGTALITVLPEQLQSPALTAEWEHRLKEVERGTLAPGDFMDGIAAMLRELVEAGLIRRISYDTVPPKVEYVLTPSGEKLIPALDILYIWSVRRMDELDIPIDADAFVVHKSEKYVDALKDIMDANHFWPGLERQRGGRTEREEQS